MASLMPQGKQAYVDAAGNPLVGGRLYTYATGTSTPLATYSDQAGTVPNTNPVILDARGEATVFWGAAGYKAVLHDAADAPIWTQDGIYPDATIASPAFTGTPTGLSTSPITATGSSVARSLAARFADTLNVKDFGAKGDGVTDDTAAFVAALAAGVRVVEWPAGTYVVSAITIPSNTEIRTAGSATIVQQSAGQGGDIRVITIDGSNVKLGSLTVRGNIATDTGEQRHAIFIRGSAAALTNIYLGTVFGENLRGDVVYVGGTTTYPVTAVTVEGVRGTNVLRNVVSITGGAGIDIGAIDGSQVGMTLLDVEPDASGQQCRGIHVGSIRGGVVMVLGRYDGPTEGVVIDSMDLDPSFQANSSPGYDPYHANAIKIAFTTRNARDVRVGLFKAANFTDHAYKHVRSGSDLTARGIVFDYVEWTNCSTTEATYHASALCSTVDDLTIGGGAVTLYSTSKTAVLGDTSTPTNTRVTMRHLAVTGGMAAKFTGRSLFDGVTVSAGAAHAFMQVHESTVQHSAVTGSAGLAGYSSKLRFVGVTAAVGTPFPSTTDYIATNSTINGTYYGNYLPAGVGINTAAPGSGIALDVGGSGFPWATAAEFKGTVRMSDPASTSHGLRLGFAGNVPYVDGYRETVGAVALTLQPSGGRLNVPTLPTYADNAAAVAGGLAAGDMYRTSTGVVMVRY